ncbi:AMP-binding protein [Nonomuraea longicatena]
MEHIVTMDPGTAHDERLARATLRLRRCGVRPGDTILICLPIGPDLFFAADAVMALGATAAPLAPDGEALDETVAASPARLMISDDPRAVTAAAESRIRVVMSVADLGA